MGPGISPDAPYLEELQRVYGSLAVGALPPGMTPIPNVFPAPNIGVEVAQRERERLGNISLILFFNTFFSYCVFFFDTFFRADWAVFFLMLSLRLPRMEVVNCMVMCWLLDALRSSQEQQQQLAAALAAGGNRANAAAVYQLFQKYSQDPAMLQRHMLALASPKDQELARMMDASSLIYHFARAYNCCSRLVESTPVWFNCVENDNEKKLTRKNELLKLAAGVARWLGRRS